MMHKTFLTCYSASLQLYLHQNINAHQELTEKFLSQFISFLKNELAAVDKYAMHPSILRKNANNTLPSCPPNA